MDMVGKQSQQTYARSGVDYSAMDPVKVLAQQTAAATAGNLHVFGAKEVAGSLRMYGKSRTRIVRL